MDDKEVKRLLERIQQLEVELKTKDQDLNLYREQAKKLNYQVAELVKNVEKEVELARKIYRLLVPTELPHISGFEFSSKFEASLISGGDYYDIFELHDKFNFGVLLSSASGHSLSALFMSILLSMNAKNDSRKSTSAEPVVESIIREVLGAGETEGSLNPNDHADLFYAIIDRRRFQMSYVSLGDVPALYLPYGANEPQLLEATGGALRSQYSEPIKAKSIILNPRDKLILVSPGLVRNTNSQGEPFGSERYFRTVIQNYSKPTHDLRHALLHELHRFIGKDRELQRDVTVLVMEAQDRVIKLARWIKFR